MLNQAALLLGKGGVAATLRKYCAASLAGADEVVVQIQTENSLLVIEQPPRLRALRKGAIFLLPAATPPLPRRRAA
jgi:hypothetical protein